MMGWRKIMSVVSFFGVIGWAILFWFFWEVSSIMKKLEDKIALLEDLNKRLRSMNAELLCQVAFEHEKRVEAESELGIAP
jgi:hypothetical protein